MTRILGVFAVMLIVSLGHSAFACATGDTPPAIAAAQGLTCEVFVDNWVVNQNTNSIDTTNTLNPASCTGATFPNGVCHWFVNNAFPNSAMTVCGAGTGSNAGGFCTNNLPPTTPVDYSVSSSGLLLHPQQLTVTGNTTSGSNQLTNISNTTGVATLGNAVVNGPGVAVGTTFALTGTTATMNATATSTNTGATYVLGNVHNGWMLNTCGYSASAPGYVGTTFTGNMYVEITVPTNPTAGPNYSGIQSEPEGWAWPIELFTGGPPASLGSNLLNIMEMDFFDWNTGTGQRVMYNESVNNTGVLSFVGSQPFGGPYYDYNAGNIGGSPYGTLIMAPSSNAGGANIGEVVNLQGTNNYSSMTYGPSVTPATAGLGFISGTAPTGAFTQLPQLHYCLQLDAAPDFPMTVTKVAVWMAPSIMSGGGGRGLFR
jgi:hypothetical protein